MHINFTSPLPAALANFFSAPQRRHSSLLDFEPENDGVKSAAKVLHALHRGGLLHSPCHVAKHIALQAIRVASETSRPHLSAHFRSIEAEKVILAQALSSASAYQNFCDRTLAHEHMVPCAVLYRIVIGETNLNEDLILQLLNLCSLRATILKSENQRLSHKTMPAGFYDAENPDFLNPLARYEAAGLTDQLIPRRRPHWLA